MNFSQLQAEVRRRLNETTAVFYTDADIQDALNEGLTELADAADYYERQANIPLYPKRTYYDLTSILPDTFLSPRRIYSPSASRWLTPTSPRELDAAYSMWETTLGPPERYWLRGNWWLGVYPKEETGSGVLRVYYSAIPPAMTLSTDEPDFPREYHFALVDYALFDCLSQQRETKKALAYFASYKAMEAKLKQWVDKREAIDRVEVLR